MPSKKHSKALASASISVAASSSRSVTPRWTHARMPARLRARASVSPAATAALAGSPALVTPNATMHPVGCDVSTCMRAEPRSVSSMAHDRVGIPPPEGRMPSRPKITRHDCVEGWSAIGKWTGVPLAEVLRAAGVLPTARYVVFRCADELKKTLDDSGCYYQSIEPDRRLSSPDRPRLRHEWQRTQYGPRRAPAPAGRTPAGLRRLSNRVSSGALRQDCIGDIQHRAQAVHMPQIVVITDPNVPPRRRVVRVDTL